MRWARLFLFAWKCLRREPCPPLACEALRCVNPPTMRGRRREKPVPDAFACSVAEWVVKVKCSAVAETWFLHGVPAHLSELRA